MTNSETFVEAPTSVPRRTKRITAGIGGGVAVEWYDWNIYGLMAVFLAPHFFPSDNRVTSLLYSLAVFGVGFFVRPLGAAILGPVADRFSHKRVMVLSISAMAVGSGVIAVMPTYDTIGWWAGAILLTVRIIQGMATGAEAGVANAIAVEVAEPGREGRYVAFVGGTCIQMGLVGSAGVAFATSAAMPAGAMGEWGWRLPFALGFFVGLVVLFLRRTLPETLIEKAMARKDDQIHESTPSLWRALWDARLALLAIVLVVGGFQIANYAFLVGLPNMANSTFSENSTVVFAITAGMGIIWLLLAPLVGAWADRIGGSKAFMITRLLLIPTFFVTLFYSEPGLVKFALVMLVGGLVVGVNMSLLNFVATSLMPRSIRVTGVGVGYAVGVSLFGGTASYLIIWLREADLFWVFPTYGAFVCTLSVIVYHSARRRGHVRIGK